MISRRRGTIFDRNLADEPPFAGVEQLGLLRAPEEDQVVGAWHSGTLRQPEDELAGSPTTGTDAVVSPSGCAVVVGQPALPGDLNAMAPLAGMEVHVEMGFMPGAD